MDFPHIGDTQFPHINTVDVYKYQNNFDYARWTGKISIKLLNVLWNSNYADVPGFESDEARDEWFDSQTGLIQTLESAFNITPENSVRIPVPYNDAYRFNYLMVDMPMQTSAEMPIDYDIANTRVQRWYYFIDSMTQYSPNTTELFLSLDVWTTFSNTIEIPYLMLERGHAPMMQTDVTTYLANPIENNEYLLAEDFNYGGNNRVVANTEYTPIGNGTKWVLFALPLTKAGLLNVGGADLTGDSTPPTFSDTNERWGYQIQVNGYEWKYGDVSYANAQLPITAMLNADSVFNGNLVFAIAATSAQGFFDDLAHNCVHLLHAIQAVFVVTDDMFQVVGESFTFRNYTIKQVKKKYNTTSFSLDKSDFDYDSAYDEITKLYTYPYAVIEITDDNGFKGEVRIENTGSISLHQELSLAFPYIQYQCFFTGLNGNGTIAYTWKNLANGTVNKTMWEDDFSSFMMKWDIPTFAVFASAEQEYAVSNYASNQAKRQRAIIDYENAVRYANTNYENVDDETDTMQANTATQNTANTAITTRSNTASTTNTARANTASQNNAGHNKTKLENDFYQDERISAEITSTRNDVLAATTALNNTCNVQSSAIGALGNTLSNPDSGFAGIGNIIGAAIQANAASGCAAIVIGNSWTQVIDLGVRNAYKLDNAKVNITNVTNENTSAHTDITAESCAANADNTATQNAANTTKINATASMMDNNADWTRKANVVAAQNNIAQVQREVEAQYANSRLGNPVMETKYSGDAYPDVFERRGIRFNIRTQTKAAIAQAGDAMLRYGYALHRVWDMSDGFHYGNHFTFWKAEDIWINEGNGLAGNAVNVIGDIFLKGVTIWRDPDEIGKVSIYDNIGEGV